MSSSTAGINSGFYLRTIVIPDMKAMAAAARIVGVTVAIDSGFRTWSSQSVSFDETVKKYGYDAGLLRTARALTNAENEVGNYGRPRRQPRRVHVGRGERMEKYGFVLSYPAGKAAVTCYQSEPWHFRWEGRARASLIHASNLTIREWLWTNVPASHV